MTEDAVVLALRAALEKNDTIDVRLALGEHLMKKEAYRDALEEFETALRKAPSDAKILEKAAESALKAGDADKASAYRLALGSIRDDGAAEASSQATCADARLEEEADADETIPGEGAHLTLVYSKGKTSEVVEEAKAITFADVAGMDAVKKALNRAFIMPIRNPALQARFGKRISGGLLLYGPPGCGKTYMAKALAGEIGAAFVNVSLNDVLDMWFGESERKLHEIFENARRLAPSVLFFDEADALGQKRSHLKGAAGRNLVNQLLSEMDGFSSIKEGVFFLAATNHPWDVDAALRRPGRFDRLVFVPPPDEKARQRIFELKITGRPFDANLDFAKVASGTQGFSGADAEALVERATEHALEESMDTGREIPINDGHIKKALKEVHPSTRPWVEVARNYAVYSNEGGVYDELYDYLRKLNLA